MIIFHLSCNTNKIFCTFYKMKVIKCSKGIISKVGDNENLGHDLDFLFVIVPVSKSL